MGLALAHHDLGNTREARAALDSLMPDSARDRSLNGATDPSVAGGAARGKSTPLRCSGSA